MTQASGQRPPRPEDLSAPATQIVRNRADYLGEGQQDIGQRVADDKLEMFVSAEPALALLQEFARHTPDFIALHDVGGSASLHLLTAVAAALNTKLQHLSIRRQGLGLALATLRFVEVPGRGDSRLRVYSTDVDADSQARRQLANVLLGHSRLGVLMVDDLPGHALGAALQPLSEGIRKGPWVNRSLLLVPRGPARQLTEQAAALAGRTPVQVKVSPQASQANDAWTYITGAWNRLRDLPPGAAAGAATEPAPLPANAPTEPMPLAPPPAARRAPPPVAPPAPAVDAAASIWKSYVQACSAIKGVVSACVFDARTLRALADDGGKPDAIQLMTQAMTLSNAMASSARALGLGRAQPDATITLAAHHLLLHPLPGHPGVVLHAVLDAGVSNLTLARMQLQRVDATVLGAAGRA